MRWQLRRRFWGSTCVCAAQLIFIQGLLVCGGNATDEERQCDLVAIWVGCENIYFFQVDIERDLFSHIAENTYMYILKPIYRKAAIGLVSLI